MILDRYIDRLSLRHKPPSAAKWEAGWKCCFHQHHFHANTPILYVLTPTYNRKTQIADLMRMKQTLQLVPNCMWIVVEDADSTNPLVRSFIEDFPNLLYINEMTTVKDKDNNNRGLQQRNRALFEAIKMRNNLSGAIYFADDDNTYDAHFLNQIRWVKRVAVFNVGLIVGQLFEGPLVSKAGKVIGWRTAWPGNREFCIDMAGFVVNMQFLLSRSKSIDRSSRASNRSNSFEKLFFRRTRKGHMENDFIKNLGVQLEDLEVFEGSNFVHVWHTQTNQPEGTGKIENYLMTKKKQETD